MPLNYIPQNGSMEENGRLPRRIRRKGKREDLNYFGGDDDWKIQPEKLMCLSHLRQLNKELIKNKFKIRLLT